MHCAISKTATRGIFCKCRFTDQRAMSEVQRRSGATIVSPSDPWFRDNLQKLTASDEQTPVTTAGEYRLLDAVYSAAIRNGVPTKLVGEVIVMLSQVHDLDSFAGVGDRITLIYSQGTLGENETSGQILYAGLDLASGASLATWCRTAPFPGLPVMCRGRRMWRRPVPAAANADARFGDHDVEIRAAHPPDRQGGAVCMPASTGQARLEPRFTPRRMARSALLAMAAISAICWSSPTPAGSRRATPT